VLLNWVNEKQLNDRLWEHQKDDGDSNDDLIAKMTKLINPKAYASSGRCTDARA
jgi:hypothetical protein